jgi:hypothetical protein
MVVDPGAEASPAPASVGREMLATAAAASAEALVGAAGFMRDDPSMRPCTLPSAAAPVPKPGASVDVVMAWRERGCVGEVGGPGKGARVRARAWARRPPPPGAAASPALAVMPAGAHACALCAVEAPMAGGEMRCSTPPPPSRLHEVPLDGQLAHQQLAVDQRREQVHGE